MRHSDILRQFELYFPNYAGDKIAVWFPNGKNSIRVRHINGEEFIFSYNGRKDWKLETANSYLENMKGEKY